MNVCTVEEMVSLDRYAIEKLGIAEEILMEDAGQASAFVLAKEVGIHNGKIVVLCGVGNNGGDGFVVARAVHAAGGDLRVFVLGDPGKFRGAAKKNLDILARLSVKVRAVTSIAEVRRDFAHAAAIVDAIFGTGLDRDVTGICRDVINLVNEHGKRGRKVVSLDIPSGVNGNTGEIMGTAVKADFTVAFGLPKRGNMLYPGYGLCGKLYVAPISFPPSLTDREDLIVSLNGEIVLPPRSRSAHKGSVGDVLFIAGAANYLGAPYFSAHSFLKAGGGYSRLAAPASVIPFIAKKGNEIVFLPQKETPAGSIAEENRDRLLALSEKVDMVVIGPGLSLDEETQRLVRELVKAIRKPLLIDGDGLTALASHARIVRSRKEATILTPHPGEMSRITGKGVAEIERDRVGVLQAAASALKAIIVLKGPHSLIGAPDGRVFINLSGNAGMATAGSGDALTGAIAAMFGLGLSPEDAARKGVFIHGLSGDLAATDKGEDGITARDIMDYLPRAMKLDRAGGCGELYLPSMI